MNGWTELAYLGLVVRPPDGPLPVEVGAWARFRARWSDTIELLGRELRMLDARNIVLELDVTERDLRVDGFPRANARLASQAVRLSFDSKHGPLRYETGEYGDWQDNVRAIALSLEALRAVDRYGVSRRGEQYRGWRALPMGAVDPVDLITTPEAAVDVLLNVTGDLYDRDDLLDDGSAGAGAHLVDAIRNAQRRTHPDTGGDPTEFRKVMKAKEVLGA